MPRRISAGRHFNAVGAKRWDKIGAERVSGTPSDLSFPGLARFDYDGNVAASQGIRIQQALATVFLDRDGVINEKMPEGQYVCSEREFRILPGVPEAIAKLNHSGIRVLVVSNQRGVALGKLTLEAIEDIHRTLQARLNQYSARIDGFFVCPHHRESCACRKPLPGLYRQAAARFPEVKAESSVVIGDSHSDIQFGHSLGMATIWIRGSSTEPRPGSEDAERLADLCCASLPEAIKVLLESRGNQTP
jgi:D-glycero-D-manno-heptose 1,7-bisphosphate phosphatase